MRQLKDSESKTIAFSTRVDVSEYEFKILTQKTQYPTIEAMKFNFARIGLVRLCGWFGITSQAYCQNNWEGVSTTLEEELIIHQEKKFEVIINEWVNETL